MSMSQLLTGIATKLPSIQGNGAAFSAAGQAMAELGVAGCIGMTCVQKGALTPTTISALSKTTFSILLPMFLGTSIMKTVTTFGLKPSSLAVPAMGIMHCLTLFLCSRYILLPLMGMEFDTVTGRSTAVCCSWGNSGVIPLIFSEALFRAPYEPASFITKCYAQVSLYLIGWSPLFWSFGRSLLTWEDADNSNSDKAKETIMSKFRGLKRLLPPPVIGVLISLFITISPFGKLFLTANDASRAKLGVVYNCFQNLGRAANPLALLVLTSSLAIGAGVGQSSSSDVSQDASIIKNGKNVDGTTQDADVSLLRRWACVAISRFIISPCLMLSMLKTVCKFGIIGLPRADPSIWFILMLQSCMPPAQNSVLMLQVADKPKEAGELAKFLFIMYATAMLPVVLIVTIALKKIGLV